MQQQHIDNIENKEKDVWGSLNPTNEGLVDKYIEDVRNNSASCYMITISRDGEYPERSVIFYEDAITAANVFNSYKDWGFAKEFLTVKMYEPTGKIHEKVMKRPMGLESTFFRQQYIEFSKLIANIKDKTDPEIYEKFVIEVAKIFSKDNMRFDEERFFKNVKLQKNN